ncbi:MAG: HNH endonuclease [Polyangiaceae bacterium]|nr:HNH endonuclease [Polyangiaceae bacterium]
MKSVPRLSREPHCLARHREKYKDAPKIGHNEQWKRFFRDDNLAFDELIDALVRCQRGLCIYCERRIAVDALGECKPDRSIEHVVPRSIEPSGTLDWKNLAASCKYRKTKPDDSSCDTHKRNVALPMGCDPRDFPVIPMVVSIELNGTITPSHEGCKSAGIDEVSLCIAISDEVLNLNCKSLRESRENVMNNARAGLHEFLNELPPESTAEEQRAAIMDKMAMELGPDDKGHLKEFWTTIRCFYGEPAETWIQQNAAIFEQCPQVST